MLVESFIFNSNKCVLKIYWNLVKGSVYSVSSGCCKRLYFFTIVIVYLSCVTFGYIDYFRLPE